MLTSECLRGEGILLIEENSMILHNKTTNTSLYIVSSVQVCQHIILVEFMWAFKKEQWKWSEKEEKELRGKSLSLK